MDKKKRTKMDGCVVVGSLAAIAFHWGAFLFGLCLLPASCASVEAEEEVEQPMVVSLTRAGGTSSDETTPLLLFWKETDFSAGTLSSPYQTLIAPGSIGDYNDTPYNTGSDYPSDNSQVVVMGLCPSGMTTADSHSTYTLPSGKAGQSDVLVTPNAVSGNRKQPFARTLEFEHATVRIVLKARRTDNTVGKLYVRNLKLTVPARLVCGGVSWDTGTRQYKAVPASAELVLSHSSQILNTEDTQIAVIYLVPCVPNDLLTDITGSGTAGLTLTADIAKDVNFTTGKRSATFPILEGSLNFMDGFGNLKTRLSAGESYETTLKFDIDSFTLEGEEKEWEDGGKMTIPVVIPEPDPSA